MVIHEFMKPPGLLDDFLARPKMKMIGVGQNDPGSAGGNLLGRQRFDGRIGSDGHEHRDLHVPMPSMENPIPRPRLRVDVFYL